MTKEQIQGQRLRYFRESHLNLNQKDFSRRIGCKQAHLSAVENGKSKLSVDIIERLYSEFSYNPNHYIIGVGSININSNVIELLPPTMQEDVVNYQTTDQKGISEEKCRKILEENNNLRKQVEQLHQENNTINNRLFKTQEKIILLLEKNSPIHMETH